MGLGGEEREGEEGEGIVLKAAGKTPILGSEDQEREKSTWRVRALSLS